MLSSATKNRLFSNSAYFGANHLNMLLSGDEVPLFLNKQYHQNFTFEFISIDENDMETKTVLKLSVLNAKKKSLCLSLIFLHL